MRTTTPQQLAQLQQQPANVRNICILAHVDHGKTTLADTLVASNGIISQRLAGKLRYLDSREDEQIRGITMKSSAISLFYNKDGEYLVNLIDSPGHIDFSSEVSTAVRLCDGAVVLIDVVEGVCPQTQAVLRQAFLENIRPVLVLNKMDRLITELKMSPTEAHNHLIQTLEQVNAVVGELFASNFMQKSSWKSKQRTASESHDSPSPQSDEKVYDWSTGLEDTDDSKIYFSPDQGNVIFASAIDGWGFRIEHFAQLYSKKLGVKAEVLQETLWGDFYLENKTKMVKKGAWSKAKKPLFVQFILENLWAVYESVLEKRDKEKTEKIVKSLNLTIAPRDAKHNNPRVYLQAICSQWLPLSNAVLGMVVEKLPSPLDMTEERVERLLCGPTRRFDSLPQQTQLLKQNFLNCSSCPDAPVIIFVSKMVAVDRKSLPQNRQRPLTQEEIAQRRELARQRHAEKTAERSKTEEELNKENEQPAGTTTLDERDSRLEDGCTENTETVQNEDDQIFIAFARIFSGSLSKGKQLYVLGPKHDPAKALEELQDGEEIDASITVKDLPSYKHITSAKVDDLYLFMGRELELLQDVPAGNVIGIGGLEDHVLKSATVSDTVACPPFTDMYLEAMPIVRVAIEPKHASDMGKLVDGMRLLNQADHSVEVLVQDTGEHVLITAGEVHLQKCLDDLTNLFAKVKLNASSPIVPFRETIIIPPKTDMVNEAIQDQNMPVWGLRKQEENEQDVEILPDRSVQITTPDKQATLHIRAVPLPDPVTKLLTDNEALIKTLDLYSQARITGRTDLIKDSKMNAETLQALREFKVKLDTAFDEAGAQWKGASDCIWSFGPRRVGPNILLNRISDYDRPSLWNCLEKDQSKECLLREYDSSIGSGFQMACLAGPLCEEPLHGICFCVEAWLQHTETSQQQYENGGSERRTNSYGPLSGQLMSIMKDGCRKALTTQPMRIVAAMYTCVISATAEVLGKLYGVLGKRNGRVLSEDMREASSVFLIEAILPVVESFGFCEEIRKKTSGLASPQLKFSHWEVIDVDPFWEPTTEEEYMHFGEKADSENIAKKYMNSVRRRKGLKVQEKLVEHAEKQRTLTRNK